LDILERNRDLLETITPIAGDRSTEGEYRTCSAKSNLELRLILKFLAEV